MNETRYDWLSDRWVIFAPNRDERPNQFRSCKNPHPAELVDCPFCFGSEHETPDPTLVLPEFDSDATLMNPRSELAKSHKREWQVRVVPNKFPAVPRYAADCDLFPYLVDGSRDNYDPTHGTTISCGTVLKTHVQTMGAEHLFQRNVPKGAHEVIIEAPTHVDSVTALSTEQIALILDAYRRRLIHWRAQRDLKYAVVFKNYGSDAGASLVHSHSQLISLDFVPRDIERINDRLQLHYKRYGQCYICQYAAEEEERCERILLRSDHFLALCPFASRFQYSFSILPRKHRSCYEEISGAEIRDLASVMKATLKALEKAHPSAAYNFVLQTSPFRGAHEESFHWRLRVIPRMSKVAGFEWGSDCFINTVTPEYAARVLREHLE